MKRTTLLLIVALLAGCAGEPIYDPDHAGAFQRNADPYPDCPTGSMRVCERQGGALTSRGRLTDCRCVQ